MTGKTCSNCGAALMPGDVFCGECGARVRAPEYDPSPEIAVVDIAPEVETEPRAGEYIPPPPAETQSGVSNSDGGKTALRIVAVVVAVGFLLFALCFCSLGGLSLIPSEEYSTAENLGFASALCFAPGIIFGLLGIGAAWLGFRKR